MQKFAPTCIINSLLLRPITSRCVVMWPHDVTQVKAKLISCRPAHFLAEYFAAALPVFTQVFLANFCKFLQHVVYFILHVETA